MRSHKEFMKDVKQASSLYGQSNKDMNCESDEDRAMYDDGIGKSPFEVEETKRDAVYTEGERQ